MQLTRHTDFALRTMLYLAASPDRLCSISEIANSHAISRNHLMKVVNQLAQAGLIASFRGRGGGIKLGRAPVDISIGDIVRASENNFDLVDCSYCGITQGCGLPRTFRDAMAAFFDILDRQSLQDLVRRPELLIPAAP